MGKRQHIPYSSKYLVASGGVPSKVRLEPPPPKEIPPNYIRRAMGLMGKRIVISTEAQMMLYLRQVINQGVLNTHQTEMLTQLRGVNDQVTMTLPKGVGKGLPR